MAPKLRFKVRIAKIERPVPEVVVIDLVPEKRPDVPPFQPGAHITLRLPNGIERQYSLCSNPEDLSHYQIAVLREPNGKGGSRWLHEKARIGDSLFCTYPANYFPLAEGAKRHIFIVGGIGITPILPMVRQLRKQSSQYIVHYCVRERTRAIFIEVLCPELEAGVAQLYLSREGECSRIDVGALLTRREEGDHVYCCGPERLIEAVLDAASHWPQDTVHFEFFSGLADEEKVLGEPFEIELASSGRVIPVPSGQTGLEALRDAGVPIPSSCEGGVCRTCVVQILAGEPVHRDRVLKPQERQQEMTICVSRATGRIKLDL